MEFDIFTTFALCAPILFYALVALFTVYGVFLAYHWFTFGSSKHISSIALATYLLGGAVLFMTYSLALQAL